VSVTAALGRSASRHRGTASRPASNPKRRALRRVPETSHRPTDHQRERERRNHRMSPTATRITTTPHRQRGTTEEAAKTAVDRACRYCVCQRCVLVEEAVSTAEREQLSYQGFLAEILLTECDGHDRRSSVRRVAAAGFPGTSGSATPISTRTRTSTPRPSIPSPVVTGSATVNLSASSATAGQGKATYSSDLALPRRSKTSGSDTRWRRSW
jgi:hypothetical protein